jgi:putative transposase
MDKSGGNPSKSTKKDQTHGQDYTKNFIWTMVFANQLFEELMKTMKLDYYTKKLTTESFLKLLLFAKLEEIESLHALSDCLFDDQLQKGVDLHSISISQLSRRLNGINPDLFQKLFLDLVAKIHAKTQYTKRVMPLKIIDSSTLPLNLTNHKWAKFRKTKAGVKLHLRLVFMDKGISYPEKALMTTAREHDRGQLDIMVDDKECMYVFDRGYLDYERFDRMTATSFFPDYEKTLLYGKFMILNYPKIRLFCRIKWY